MDAAVTELAEKGAAQHGPGRSREAVVEHVLGLLSSPPARAALRRGGVVSMEHRAYPYLARFWAGAPWKKRPILALGHLAAMTDARQEHGVLMGVAIRRRVKGEGLSESSAERKLTAMQSADLENLVPWLRSLLSQCASVDWFDVHRFLIAWDHPNDEVRRSVRRRLLEQFYFDSASNIDLAEEPLL